MHTQTHTHVHTHTRSHTHTHTHTHTHRWDEKRNNQTAFSIFRATHTVNATAYALAAITNLLLLQVRVCPRQHVLTHVERERERERAGERERERAMNPRKRAHTTLAASKRAVFHGNACSNLFVVKSARPDVPRVYSRVRAHTRHTRPRARVRPCVRASVIVSAHTPTEV